MKRPKRRPSCTFLCFLRHRIVVLFRIASSAEYNETSKTSSIRKLVKKTMREFEKPKKYVTSRKKGGVSILPKRKGESDGVVRVVDRRLKKDKRGKLKRNKKRSRR